MKTIGEAMELVCRFTRNPKEIQTAAKEMTEGLERRESLCKEIGDNPTVLDFCSAYVEKVGPEIDFNPHSLALCMFINGVLIGMEMERQDLPEQPAAPVLPVCGHCGDAIRTPVPNYPGVCADCREEFSRDI